MKTSLYKIDNKNKLRYLTVWSEGSTIYNESGVVGTTSPVIHSKQAKPKNLGRSNETTAEEQAISEVKSFITSKLDEGYSLTIEEAKTNSAVFPMLAQELTKNLKKVDWKSTFVSPKLDGMRCLIFVKENSITLMSRKGKAISTMPHIEKGFADWRDSGLIHVGDIFDGELYVHGEGFQSNMSFIKKYQEGLSERIIFNCYDVVSNEAYKSRWDYVSKLPSSDFFSVVGAYECENLEQVREYHKSFLSEGYEGTMLRHGDTGYEQSKRSYSLLKFKDFIDIQLPILDIIPAEQRPEWGIPVFHWEGAIDDVIKAGVKMSHKDRCHILSNKDEYIGKMAEIRFFEYTDRGVPRFPIMVGIRLDR